MKNNTKHEKHGTIIDYLKWRGDLTLNQSPFNEVDGLILSVLAYLDYSHVSENEVSFLSDAINKYLELAETESFDLPIMMKDDLVDFAIAAATSQRFKGIGICHYVNHIDLEKELQFSAVTFLLPDNTAYLAFRGTDNTLVGWKEDFNMSFIDSVPAQIEAAAYAQKVMETLDMPIRAGGHSKGGNLAIWACAHLSEDEKKTIVAIYNNDGPGFRDEFFHSDAYASIRDRIHSFVPESSIVGVLMNHDDYTTILSNNNAALQHDPFSWGVLGASLVYDDDRTRSGKRSDKRLNTWIDNMSMEEREGFVNNMYEIITSSKARTLTDIDHKKLRSLFLMSKSFREMEKDEKSQVVNGLLKIFINEDTLANKKLLHKILHPEEFAQQKNPVFIESEVHSL